MTKIQCVKDFECEVCHRKGMLQILGNYGRVRHYVGLDSVSKKPKFEYHKQRVEYIRQIQNIDLSGQNNIDLKLLNKGSIIENTWAGSLARLGHLLDVQKVAGSSPVRPTKHQPETFLLEY